MFKRCLIVSALPALVAAMALMASAQMVNLAPLVGKTAFTPEDTAALQAMIENDVRTVATSVQPRDVGISRDRLIRLPQYGGATDEFKQLTSRLTLTAVAQSLDVAREHRNRLALAITVARSESPEAVELLLTLLGDRFASIRYWAAQGLSADPVVQAIKRGRQDLPTSRVFLGKVQVAFDAETDPVVAETLFGLLQAVSTDLATDILVEQAQKKAVAFDLSKTDALNAMQRAVVALQAAYEREIRPGAEGKQKIIVALGQILIQTPPHGRSLELVEQTSAALAELTKQKSEIAKVVEEYRKQGAIRDSKLIDLIWLEQLGWIQQLQLNDKVKLLDWSPQKSVEATRASLRS